MWLSFVGALLACLAFAYIPGFLFVRSARFSPTMALAVAPPLSLLAYSLACFVLHGAGFKASWPAVFAVALALALIACATSVVWNRRRAEAGAGRCAFAGTKLGGSHARHASASGRLSFSAKAMLAYFAVGIVIGSVFFLVAIRDPNCFVQAHDNITHMGILRAFVATGDLNPQGATVYFDTTGTLAAPYANESSSYPSVWHMLGAMIAGATGASVPMAINVMSFAFSFIMYPLGMAQLLLMLFKSQRSVVYLGSVACLAFEVFPWELMVFGPLYPNLASLALVPATLVLMLCLFSTGNTRGQRIAAAVLVVASLAGLALIQPNAVFTAGVLIAPYLVLKASEIPSVLPHSLFRRRIWRVVFAVAAVVAIAAIWWTVYHLPALESVLQQNRWPYESKKRALVDALTLSFIDSPAQLLLALCVALGALCAFFDKQARWVVASYVIACGLYCVAVSMDGFVDSLLTGFWYGDQYRIGSMMVMAGAPLAAMGMSALVKLALRGADIIARQPLASGGQKALSLFVALCLTAGFFMPNYEIRGHQPVDTAFGYFGGHVRGFYKMNGRKHLSQREVSFLHGIDRIIAEDGLILNMPFDGSAYVTGALGLPLYYRQVSYIGADNETEQSRIIRQHLNEIADNEDVQKAVRDVGAKYVLVLDQGNTEEQAKRHGSYAEPDWIGIESITDDTPGFEPVLADDDMRLYRIDPAYTAE